MRKIAKWTFLCIICTALGFGATYLVANSDHVLQTVVAMFPVPQQPTLEELTAQTDPALMAADEIARADAAPVDVMNVEMAGELAAAELPALAPLAAEGTVNTFAAGPLAVEANREQSTPSSGPLNAVGVIAVVRDRQVVLEAGGRVDEIAVEVGDTVEAGDLLISLDTTYLDWAVEQAEIGFETARIDFEEAGKLVDDADIAVAEANLLVAQENLAEVEAGPTDAERAAAESSVAAAWARVEELQEGPNPNQIIIAQAALRRAEIAVEAAQREYDKIAWLPEAAATSAADDLQDATVNLESARAAYAEAVKPPSQADIQSAVASAQNAQAALNELELKPTPAELASAKAQLAQAQAALDEVNKGPQQAEVRKAELGVRQAMINLEDARMAQASAQVLAPIDGTVLSLNVDLGQDASAGNVVAALADTADVKLTVNVEQRDIARVIIGQEVQIAIYALSSDSFTGVVERIAPIADAETGFVTFPVIIRFTDGPLERVLPGMTASATFLSESAEATVEPTEEATEEPTEEATVEATPEPTEESSEEPAADATATPSN